MGLAGSSHPAHPAFCSGWVLGQAAVGKGCSPASASSCPAPADEARCGGRMLREEQGWGAAFLVPSCARGLLVLDDY